MDSTIKTDWSTHGPEWNGVSKEDYIKFLLGKATVPKQIQESITVRANNGMTDKDYFQTELYLKTKTIDNGKRNNSTRPGPNPGHKQG